MSLSLHESVRRITLDSFVTENASRELDAQFTSLVTRQSRFVFRVAYSVLRHAHDAEDVVQEMFMKLYRTGAWKTMQDEKGFLARATWRLAVDSHRTRNRTVEPTESIYAIAGDPENDAIKADREQLVLSLIDSLPEELRLPLTLSTMEELTSAEIGAIMNVSDATVRSRLARARQVLKEKTQSLLGVRDGRTR